VEKYKLQIEILAARSSADRAQEKSMKASNENSGEET
jgi:hypothetical protein